MLVGNHPGLNIVEGVGEGEGAGPRVLPGLARAQRFISISEDRIKIAALVLLDHPWTKRNEILGVFAAVFESAARAMRQGLCKSACGRPVAVALALCVVLFACLLTPRRGASDRFAPFGPKTEPFCANHNKYVGPVFSGVSLKATPLAAIVPHEFVHLRKHARFGASPRRATSLGSSSARLDARASSACVV